MVLLTCSVCIHVHTLYCTCYWHACANVHAHCTYMYVSICAVYVLSKSMCDVQYTCICKFVLYIVHVFCIVAILTKFYFSHFPNYRAPRLALALYYLILLAHLLSIVYSFILFAPFTFGYPSLSTPDIKQLLWVETWDLLSR